MVVTLMSEYTILQIRSPKLDRGEQIKKIGKVNIVDYFQKTKIFLHTTSQINNVACFLMSNLYVYY